MESNYCKKTRIIVLTDISSIRSGVSEPDDTQSLVRLLLYTSQFEIEGLIATYSSHVKGIKPEYIRAAIAEYEKVYNNLLLHDPTFADPRLLMNAVRGGNPVCGVDQVGPGMDTEGSDMIIDVVDRDDPRPVWITIWGRPLELAQALWKVSNSRSKEECGRFKSKIRVYAIGDQYDTTGHWIKENHADLFYITAYKALRGIYKGGDASTVSSQWVIENINTGHGALGAFYPDYNGGDPWGKVKGVKEGDTPLFLYLMQNGLSDPMMPSWGSWGGRFEEDNDRRAVKDKENIYSYLSPHCQYSDAKGTVNGETGEWATVYRWRPAFQASFQARLDWCAKSYGEANHEPVAVIDGETERIVKPGSEIVLSAKNSYDPDGDKLSFNWYYYPEPGSYRGELEIKNSHLPCSSFVAPPATSTETLHIILTVTDDGEPCLSSYKRIVFKIVPE